ncbi:LysR family transcriptional regulator [Roseobacter sp.]|uniref:LysR family transcriptional regulator n=1 Tax=Roseobacter sp. TaxID=1907202 RepID=UPI002966EDD5|nr:LysR family transcriptional regulator [Roseobacter sp.]MDW3180830.1 LysR family transcriptional regulator [Roseobacter sp.]
MKDVRLKWDDAPVFLAVARSGTLTGAADMLGTGIATVSRRIQRLEEALGMPLFVHHQTGYKLTDEGAALLPRAEALEEAMLSFRAGVTAEAEVTGHVRLATAENLANPIIIPALPALLDRHPHLTLDVITDVATANLHRREADLAVRMVRPTGGNVTIRRIGTIGFGLYGSLGYMAARRAYPEEGLLENDRVIGWSERQNTLPTAQWIERALRGRAPVLMTSTLAAQMSAAQADIGLAVLPHFLAREAGLQPLPVELGLDQPIWLVLHSDLSASQRVRVVADHLVEIFRQNGDRLKQARAEKPR